MSYDAERIGITRYLQANAFFGISPFGLAGEPMGGMAAGAGFMVLVHGRAVEASTGAPGANLHRYTGLLSITIAEPGGDPDYALADAVINGLTGKKIDETGALVSASSGIVIDFAPQGQAPYIAESRAEAPFHRVVVNAPFNRIERK